MTFSQKAVEAAARACYEHEPLERDDFVEIPWDELGQGTRDRFMHKARATVSAALAVDGLALVPRKLTPDMIVQGYEHVNRDLFEGKGDALNRLWSAMLNAASPPVEN